jgi:threonine/homoserine/homoserine lactone efflux protein
VGILPDARVEVVEHRGAYLTGLATNLCNPKAVVFAVSMLPQFIVPAGHVFLSVCCSISSPQPVKDRG